MPVPQIAGFRRERDAFQRRCPSVVGPSTEAHRACILGRRVKPKNTGFPQALADYLANEDLIAYAEEDAEA